MWAIEVGRLCRSNLPHLPVDWQDLKRQFGELQEQRVTPLKDGITSALSEMPAAALPIIEQYQTEAKARKKWQQKRIFETAALAIRRRESS